MNMLVHAVQPFGCLIEAEKSADIGSQVVGVIDQILVERGDIIRKGQVVAVLKAQPERAAATLARIRQEAEGEVRAAEAAATLANQHLKRTEELHQRNFISKQALDQAQSEAEVARQRAAQARDNRRAASGELEVSQAQLSQRTILAPFDAVVTERYMTTGERVEEKPIIRIAQINPLRVQVVLPVSFYGKVALGHTAKVTPELPNGKPVAARVMRIDKVVDPASNTFRALLRIDNTGHALPAGLRCTIDFQADPAPATGDSRPSSAPSITETTKLDRTAIETQIEAWRRAWQQRDINRYLAFYADRFTPHRGLNRDAWQAERRQRLARPEKIELRIEQLQITPHSPDEVRAVFVQHFQSNQLTETSKKELVWHKIEGRWQIIRERQLLESS